MTTTDLTFTWDGPPCVNGRSGADHVASDSTSLRATATVRPGLYVVVDIDAYATTIDEDGIMTMDADECHGYGWETCTTICLTTSLDDPWNSLVWDESGEYEEGVRRYRPIAACFEDSGPVPWWYITDPLASMVEYVKESMDATYRAGAEMMVGTTPDMLAAIEREITASRSS